MSSLKDIMDVDVEPLESQAIRRSKEAAAASQSNLIKSTSSTSSATTRPADEANLETRELPTLKRRRSDRVPNSSRDTSVRRPSLSRRRSSGATVESMDSYMTPSGAAGGSSRMSSSGSNAPPDSVRYTPVTGRVSRAKKGQRVHICDLCDPPRLFTRAEHLRRHQLGHQNPAYPCTFEDCEKAFHRPDLLSRHLQRHETQGEKPYKAEDSTRSRSSSASNSSTPPSKVTTPKMRLDTTVGSPISASGSSTAHTSASTESATTITAFDAIKSGFEAVSFSGPSHNFSSGQFGRPAPNPSRQAPSSSGPGGNQATMSNPITSFPISRTQAMTPTSPFMELSSNPNISQIFSSSDADMFPSPAQTVPVLTLQVPDLAYANSGSSPWYSSSDSTWSTPSDTTRFAPGVFGSSSSSRDRSNSSNTANEWTHSAIPWSPGVSGMHTPRSQTALLETVPERFESPPYLSPHLSPQAISYPMLGGGGVVNGISGGPGSGNASGSGGYGTDILVGAPTTTLTRLKKRAQNFPAVGNAAGSRRPLRSKRSAVPATVSAATTATAEFVGADAASVVDGTDLAEGSWVSVRMGGVATSLGGELDVEVYLKSYQIYLEPLYFFIHSTMLKNQLVRDCIIALGTQFHDRWEDRQFGSRVHESCVRRLEQQFITWDIPTMHATYLTEVFARFRSKRPDINFSERFRTMYQKLLSSAPTDSTSTFTFTHLTPQTLSSLLTHHAPESPHPLQTLWHHWLDHETTQRLRAACFILEIHASTCFETPRLSPTTNFNNTYIPLPCPAPLWQAPTPEAWHALLLSNTYPAPSRLTDPHLLTRTEVFALPLATQVLGLLGTIALLPLKSPLSSRRAKRSDDDDNDDAAVIAALTTSIATEYPDVMCPHNYLSLYHTPVRSLLALTGRTWVLGTKMTDASEIDALPGIIRKWVAGEAGCRAVHHACRALWILVTMGREALHSASQWYCNYLAGLVVWAFGHGVRGGGGGGGRGRGDAGSAALLPNATTTTASTTTTLISNQGTLSTSDTTATAPPSPPFTTTNNLTTTTILQAHALTYLNSMIAHPIGSLHSAPQRGDTSAVLAVVRMKLEEDAVCGDVGGDVGGGRGVGSGGVGPGGVGGGKGGNQAQCALLLDAVGVLRWLEREGGRRIF